MGWVDAATDSLAKMPTASFTKKLAKYRAGGALKCLSQSLRRIGGSSLSICPSASGPTAPPRRQTTAYDDKNRLSRGTTNSPLIALFTTNSPLLVRSHSQSPSYLSRSLSLSLSLRAGVHLEDALVDERAEGLPLEHDRRDDHPHAVLEFELDAAHGSGRRRQRREAECAEGWRRWRRAARGRRWRWRRGSLCRRRAHRRRWGRATRGRRCVEADHSGAEAEEDHAWAGARGGRPRGGGGGGRPRGGGGGGRPRGGRRSEAGPRPSKACAEAACVGRHGVSEPRPPAHRRGRYRHGLGLLVELRKGPIHQQRTTHPLFHPPSPSDALANSVPPVDFRKNVFAAPYPSRGLTASTHALAAATTGRASGILLAKYPS